ncbi:MAG: hypothetical protein ACTSXA_03800 [Candidatus Heimdallarchaeota archaeon]
MVQCTYCDKQSVNTCSKCQSPSCSKHSHYKDPVLFNLIDANLAGNKYAYEVLCNDCDTNFISFDFLKGLVGFILLCCFLTAIASLIAY